MPPFFRVTSEPFCPFPVDPKVRAHPEPVPPIPIEWICINRLGLYTHNFTNSEFHCPQQLEFWYREKHFSSWICPMYIFHRFPWNVWNTAMQHLLLYIIWLTWDSCETQVNVRNVLHTLTLYYAPCQKGKCLSMLGCSFILELYLLTVYSLYVLKACRNLFNFSVIPCIIQL